MHCNQYVSIITIALWFNLYNRRRRTHGWKVDTLIYGHDPTKQIRTRARSSWQASSLPTGLSFYQFIATISWRNMLKFNTAELLFPNQLENSNNLDQVHKIVTWVVSEHMRISYFNIPNIQCGICNLVLLVKVNTRNINHARAARPIFDC